MTTHPMRIMVEVTSKGQERLIQNMAKKLRNSASNKHRKWGQASLKFLFGRLQDEITELEEAGAATAWEEAADIANFAAMIADNKSPTPIELIWDDSWMERELKKAADEVKTWPKWKRDAMREALSQQ